MLSRFQVKKPQADHCCTPHPKGKVECPSCHQKAKGVLGKTFEALVKVVVGLKEGASPATVCYCFGWSKEKIRAELDATGKTSALEEIKAKMENLGCSCEVLNPSGGCCLGDVAKAIKELQQTNG
ncbi:MAG: hypothetical protein FAF05_05715 [Epsilonproteobacteria bacterium]|nr:hypothetical protein [Campylobacterota bacterium]